MTDFARGQDGQKQDPVFEEGSDVEIHGDGPLRARCGVGKKSRGKVSHVRVMLR